MLSGKDESIFRHLFDLEEGSSVLIERPKTKWHDVIGLDEVKATLLDGTVVLPMKQPQLCNGWFAFIFNIPWYPSHNFMTKILNRILIYDWFERQFSVHPNPDTYLRIY